MRNNGLHKLLRTLPMGFYASFIITRVQEKKKSFGSHGSKVQNKIEKILSQWEKIVQLFIYRVSPRKSIANQTRSEIIII